MPLCKAPINDKKKKINYILDNLQLGIYKDARSDNTKKFHALSHIDLSPVLKSRINDDDCFYANDPNIKCFHTNRRRSSVGEIPTQDRMELLYFDFGDLEKENSSDSFKISLRSNLVSDKSAQDLVSNNSRKQESHAASSNH